MTADVMALLRTELRVERRTGGTLLVLAPYAVAALALVAITTGADLPLLRRLSPGLLWAVVVVLGVLTTMRQGYAEDPTRRDLLHLLGMRPEAVWIARVLAAATLVAALEVVLTVAAVVLLDLAVGDPLLHAAAVPVTALGLAALGVLARDLADGARSGVALVPLVVVPLAVPLALAPVQARAVAEAGGSGWTWIALAALVTTVTVGVGIAAAANLQEVAS